MITIISKILESEYNELLSFIRKDNARNYFIRLGLESNKTVYDEIWEERDKDNNLNAVLFKRRSGNLQFYAKGIFDVDGFSEYIAKTNFKYLISPASYCDLFLNKNLFTSYKEGAIIAKLDCSNYSIGCNTYSDVEPLRIDDLDELVNLYEKVFTSFSPISVMEEKIKTSRGRGVCIRQNGKLVSVAQSEFEEEDSALVVGVATAPEFQGKGLASKCLNSLCSKLMIEGKNLYLQYDNLDAGRIYEGIGFTPIDKVIHYKGNTKLQGNRL